MKIQSRGRSDVLNELMLNPRRLGIAQVVIGICASFVFWMRPGTFRPHLSPITTDVVEMVVSTCLVWAPYLLSATVSIRLLADRRPLCTWVFIGVAIAIAVGSAGFYLHWYGLQTYVAPIIVSVGVTLGLVGAAGICALVW